MRVRSPSLDDLVLPSRHAGSGSDVPLVVPTASPAVVVDAGGVRRIGRLSSWPAYETLTLHYEPDDAERTGCSVAPPSAEPVRDDSHDSLDLLDLLDLHDVSDLRRQRIDGVSFTEMLRLEPDIQRFLHAGRIGGIGAHVLTGEDTLPPDLYAHPCDIAAKRMPPAQYPVILTSRKALDLAAVDLRPVETVAVDMSDLGLEAFDIQPPAHPPADAPSTDPAAREIIPKVYRQILGHTAVFQTDGKWNIATASGVIEMQRRTRIGNLMFVMFGTASTTFVYFAQDIDPHASTAPILPIQWLMNGADKLCGERLTLVDARCRLQHATAHLARHSAFASYRGASPTIASAPMRAEQAIAEAMKLDRVHTAIVTRVLVNRLADVETSSADMLASLRGITHHAIDYLYLRDAGVRRANSHLTSIKGLQALAQVVNDLRDHWIVGHEYAMRLSALRLLEKSVVANLSHGLKHASGDPAVTADLYTKAIVGYLKLLTSLMADGVLAPRAVWNTLKTIPGQRFTSRLGERAHVEARPARAFVRLLDQFFAQALYLSRITSVLIAGKAAKCEGFYRTIFAASKANTVGAAEAMAIRDELVNKGYVGVSAAIRISRKNLDAIHARQFQVLNPEAREQRQNQTDSPEPANKVLDALHADLSHDAFERIEAFTLAEELRTQMPTLPLNEQHGLREMMRSAVETEWCKTLPKDTLPSSLTTSVIASEGPKLGHRVAQARKPARDRIVAEAVDAYTTYLQTHPDASTTERLDARSRAKQSAISAYRTLIAAHGDKTSSAAQAAATSSRELASTSAAARIAQQSATAATASVAVQAVAKHAVERSTQHAQATASKAREAANQALLTAKLKLQEFNESLARVARESAMQRSLQESRERAQREAEARASNALDASRSAERERQAREDAARRQGALLRAALSQPSTSQGARAATRTEVVAAAYDALLPTLPDVPTAPIPETGRAASAIRRALLSPTS
ncbi:hypothetical protein [Pandoraea anhela]|nr:hypothetical protein [Pandoraea anhela]